MWNAEEELARFDKIPLSVSDKEKILYKNAKEFLNL